MHDLRWIRENPEEFDRGLERRFLPPRATEVLALDKEWRASQTKAEELQAERNRLSREVGVLKARGEPAEALLAEIACRKEQEGDHAARAADIRKQIDDLLAGLPNLPAPEVPAGPDETANIEVRRVGEPRRFNFEPKPHEALGQALGQMDFQRAAKLSGSRFVVLRGALARLERALGEFMLDLHTREFGYEEISPPVLVRDDAMFGTTQLPKFAEESFQTREGYWLIPTSEVALANLYAGEILDAAALPIRLTAWTPCFRSEAGAAGKDTRGMIRQHQFEKVELISLTRPEESEAEHDRMTRCAEAVLQRLDLAYRVMLLSSGDMGFAAHKTYDLEVWLPGQNAYREISSCSNCGAFQARRNNTRFRPAGGRGTQFVHTLNGSGLAIGRTLIAILENYQQGNGTIAIPGALQPYMGGQTTIGDDR
jgi:seryl-tRNA synthetase